MTDLCPEAQYFVSLITAARLAAMARCSAADAAPIGSGGIGPTAARQSNAPVSFKVPTGLQDSPVGQGAERMAERVAVSLPTTLQPTPRRSRRAHPTLTERRHAPTTG